MIEEQTNIYKHYVISPTMADILNETYDEDDSGITEEEQEALAEEYTEAEVNGNEGLNLYSVIFKDLSNRSKFKPLESVEGNEGLFDTIIKWVKKIFSSIINFFKDLLGLGRTGEIKAKDKKLKNLKFDNLKDLPAGEVLKVKPSKSVYLIYPDGPKPPVNLDFIKPLTEIFDRELSSFFLYRDDLEKRYDGYRLVYVTKTFDLETGEQTGEETHDPKGEKDYETVNRENIITFIKKHPRYLNYELSATDSYKVDIKVASNVVPASTEPSEIEITRTDRDQLLKLAKETSDKYFTLTYSLPIIERYLKDITNLEKKFTAEVNKNKNNPEAMKAAQESLKRWSSAFEFWKYFHSHLNRKLLEEPLHAAYDLLVKIDSAKFKGD